MVELQPAFILRQRPYRETSVLLQAFTREYGIISVLARGVRKAKSKLAGQLQPFYLLQLSYLDPRELKILTQAETAQDFNLQGLPLYCGFYLNELLQKCLHPHDPHPELFDRYRQCLQALAAGGQIETELRYFELDLLRETGFGADLSMDAGSGDLVGAGRRYDYIPGYGLTAAASGIASGAVLTALNRRAALTAELQAEAKLLLRRMLDECLAGQTLNSREVLAAMLKFTAH